MKSTYKFPIVILLFFIFSNGAHSQNLYSLTIKVIDEKTKLNLKNVDVFVEQTHTSLITNFEGLTVVPKILKKGKVTIRATKDGYYPYYSNESVISSKTEDNIKVIELIPLHQNQIIVFGKVENQKKDNIPNLPVELYHITPKSKKILTDTLGNYQFLILLDSIITNKIKIKTDHPNYKVSEKEYIINPSQLSYEISFQIKKKINWNPVFFKTSIGTGVGFIIRGGIKFKKAKLLHDDYESCILESSFLNKHPEYNNRNEAYFYAENQRKKSRNLIFGGSVFIITPIVNYFIKKKRKVNNRANLDLGINNGLSEAKFVYKF